MSYEAMAWAVKVIERHPEWKTPIRFVLLIMANRADEEGNLYPSVRWIMSRTALAESTVRTATRALQKAGYLLKQGRTRDNGDGGQTSNAYRLPVELEPTPPAYGAGGGASNAGEPLHTVQGVPAYHAPQETKERDKRKEGESPSARRRRWPADFAVSDGVRRWYAGRVKSDGWPPDLLEAHFEAFHRKAKASGYKYVDWDQAFQNAVIEDWGEVRRNAQRAAPGGKPGGPPWWQTEQGMLAKGEELGIRPRPGESWPEFRGRINNAIETRMRATA